MFARSFAVRARSEAYRGTFGSEAKLPGDPQALAIVGLGLVVGPASHLDRLADLALGIRQLVPGQGRGGIASDQAFEDLDRVVVFDLGLVEPADHPVEARDLLLDAGLLEDEGGLVGIHPDELAVEFEGPLGEPDAELFALGDAEEVVPGHFL